MVLVKIDIKNIASETHPDDRVVFRSPVVREAVGGGLVSTADEVVSLVDGVGEVELVPGPVIVNFHCRGMADTRPKRGTVPDSGTVTVADVIGDNFTYSPEVVGAAQAAKNAAENAAGRAEDAADLAWAWADGKLLVESPEGSGMYVQHPGFFTESPAQSGLYEFNT